MHVTTLRGAGNSDYFLHNLYYAKLIANFVCRWLEFHDVCTKCSNPQRGRVATREQYVESTVIHDIFVFFFGSE